jgi:hypothetical protein
MLVLMTIGLCTVQDSRGPHVFRRGGGMGALEAEGENRLGDAGSDVNKEEEYDDDACELCVQ